MTSGDKKRFLKRGGGGQINLPSGNKTKLWVGGGQSLKTSGYKK